MFIAHYKSVNSPEEFFSSQRENLDFPTQVEYKNKRYLLNTTYQFGSTSQKDKINFFAKENKIDFDVEI
jgi:hypothetical protein